MRTIGCLLGLASLLAGCSREPGVYDLPVSEALARLKNADTDAFRTARQCGILVHFSAGSPRDNAITWRVTSSGTEMLRFTVRLVAEGDGTRAQIEVPAAPDGGELYDGKQFYPRPALNQPLRPAVGEFIASTLEGREYRAKDVPRSDKVCGIQRAGLESGSFRFGADDAAGMDSRGTARLREQQEDQAERDSTDQSYGQPMDDTAGNW